MFTHRGFFTLSPVIAQKNGQTIRHPNHLTPDGYVLCAARPQDALDPLSRSLSEIGAVLTCG
jgi:hypothetical protein